LRQQSILKILSCVPKVSGNSRSFSFLDSVTCEAHPSEAAIKGSRDLMSAVFG